MSQRGLTALERKDWPAAEGLLGRAVEACPADPEARRHYAEALWHCDKPGEAIAQLDEAVRLSSDDPTLRVRAAEMRLFLGQIQAAREEVERAIDLDPKAPAAWALRGRLRRDAGAAREALADYHRALGYDPDNRQVLLEIAELYRQLGEPRRALANLQSLIETHPPGEEPQQVLYLAGLAYAALGRHGDAADSLAAARDRGRPSREILLRLAEAQLLAGRRALARSSAQQALALDPEHAASRALVATIDLAGDSAGGPDRR